MSLVPQDGPLAPVQEPSIGQLLSAAIQHGATSEQVAVAKDLMAMYREQKAEEAKNAALRDLAVLQEKCGKIQEASAVANRDGSLRYTYSKLEELMAHVRPHLKACNFSHAFDEEISGDRVTATFRLMHKDGYEHKGCASRRISGNDAQADTSAATTAKRYALCNALGIVTEAKEDASLRFGSISEEQAKSIRFRVERANIPEAKFLKWAGAATYEAIDKARYASVDEYLTGKGV